MSEHNAEKDLYAAAQVEAVEAVAQRWADVLDECKAADPRWILDRSVMTLDTALTELRRALLTRATSPAVTEESR